MAETNIDRRSFLDRSARAAIAAAISTTCLKGHSKQPQPEVEKDKYWLVTPPKDFLDLIGSAQDDIAALRAANYGLDQFTSGSRLEDDKVVIKLVGRGIGMDSSLQDCYLKKISPLHPLIGSGPGKLLVPEFHKHVDGRLYDGNIDLHPFVYAESTENGLVCYVADPTDPRRKCVQLGPFETLTKNSKYTPKDEKLVTTSILDVVTWLVDNDTGLQASRITPAPNPDLMVRLSDTVPSDSLVRRARWDKIIPDPWQIDPPFEKTARVIQFNFFPTDREKEVDKEGKVRGDWSSAARRIDITGERITGNQCRDIIIEGDIISLYPLKAASTDLPEMNQPDADGNRYEQMDDGTVRLFSRPVFTEDPNAPDYAPLVADMKYLGHGEDKHVLCYRKQWKPFTQRDGYFFYSDASDDVNQSIMNDEKLEHIMFGVRRAALLFSAENRMNKIRIVDYNLENAFYNSGYPDVVNITDDWVKNSSATVLLATTTHEVLHGFDDAFKIVESSDHIPKLWDKYRKDEDFMDFIRDANFYGQGGHPETDPGELFVSLFHSLMSPDLEEKLDGTDDKMRGKYLDAIGVLDKALKAAEGIDKGAPIYPRIQDIIKHISIKKE